LEFEFRGDGRLRYSNNSQYKAENLIRKEGKLNELVILKVFVNEIILDQLRKIIVDSGILKEDDKKWPEPDRVGR
jgi:protein mago nashi